MQNFQNGQYNVPSSCGTGSQIPAVAFYQAQPEPTCPAPGVTRLATNTQGRQYQNPERSCRLELDDVVGNTTLGSLLVLGNDECFPDEVLRAIFEVPETTIIIRPEENCRIWMSQFTEGAFTFTITGSEDARNAQFAQNAKQFLFSVINANDDCAFKVTRDNRCSPCENGELIQSFGSINCSPVVAGPQALFAYEIVAGATLEDVVLCVCSYSVPNMVSCVAPPVCPPAPPAPPTPVYGPFNGQNYTNGNGMNGNAAPFNGNGR